MLGRARTPHAHDPIYSILFHFSLSCVFRFHFALICKSSLVVRLFWLNWCGIYYILLWRTKQTTEKKLKSRRRSLTWRPNVRTRPRMRDGAKIIINAFRSIKTNDWYVLWNSGHGANACTFPFSVPTTNYLLFFYCFVLSSLFHTRTHAWALYPSQYFTLNEMMVNREHKMWTYVT